MLFAASAWQTCFCMVVGSVLPLRAAFPLFLALAETGVEEFQYLGRELAGLQRAEGRLEVVAHDAFGPLIRRLVELGDTEPAVEEEGHAGLVAGSVGCGLSERA
ncbi:hypothetical protein [Streptomyces regalis]|nr:hypothetical protein [Streptomyces regalis]